jgi:UTP:GlnB (protein PII) uridylyltransferase
MRKLDVVAARAYSRLRTDGEREAVILLSVQRLPEEAETGPIDEAEIAAVGAVLDELVRGTLDVEWVVKRASARARHGSFAPGGTWVRFEHLADGCAPLVVETHDRPALLLTITRCLFGLGLQVTSSDLSSNGGRVHDWFTLAELDGGPVLPAKHPSIERALSAAIENLGSIANAPAVLAVPASAGGRGRGHLAGQ